MESRKSPSQYPKPSLPSPTHQVFETQHRWSSPTHQVFETQHSWSRWPVATNSCPAPRRFSQQNFSVLDSKLIVYCTNHFFPTVIYVVFKMLMRGEQLTMDEECSQMRIRMVGEFVYIMQLRIWLIFHFTNSVWGTKNKQYHMATYCRRMNAHISILQIRLLCL